LRIDTPVLAALVAALAALVTSFLSLIAQRRTAAFQFELNTRRDDVQRAAELQRVMTQYRHPLLQAATDLQSRLYNIVRGRLLEVYGRGTEDERRYVIDNSSFVFAEYFGWVEALRREVQFLDFGADAHNRKVQSCLEAVASAFLRDDMEKEFRIFRGQQRAMGEVMLVPRNSGGLECIGMANFTKRLDDPEFSRWFHTLRRDLEELIEQPTLPLRRIERLQGTLVDLIDCLDPQAVRVPSRRRRLGEITETGTAQGVSAG
jgi:hypothetical protein